MRITSASRPLVALVLLLVASMLAGFAAPGAEPTTSDTDRLNQQELTQVHAVSYPTVTAKSAAVVDTDTGRVLWSLNGSVRRPMASTAKMVNALVALRYADPDEMATVYPRDLVGGSSAHLRAGERLSLEQLLYAALIPSGNDAAYTIADYVGRTHLGGVGDDGIAAFVRAMNRYVEQMGLRNTHFETPNGFDAPGQYSTALDLAMIGRQVLRNPLLANIVSTQSYRVTGYMGTGANTVPVYHYVTNTNELLGTYGGANGIKTGTTYGAGEVLVASARRGHSALIVVVMGSQDRFSDARTLLDWGFATYKWVPLSSRQFLSTTRRATSQAAYTAVQSWNLDLTIYVPGPRRPHYWAGTIPLDPYPLFGELP